MTYKVLHVIARFNVGGTATFLHTLFDSWKDRTFDHLLLTGNVQDKEVEDSRLYSIPFIRIEKLGRRLSFLDDFLAFIEIRRLIKEERPDIIVTHTFKAGLLCRIMSTGVPVVHFFHGHLLRDPGFSKFAQMANVKIERFLAKRTKVLCATGEAVRQDLSNAGVVHPNFELIYPGLIANSTYSDFLADGAEHQSKCFRLLGIDSHPLIKCQSLVVSWHARDAKVKNLELTLEIARDMPDALFLISGPGTKERFNNILTPANIVPLGVQPSSLVFGACDVVISTSFNEGLSLSIIEASALGKPCIVTDVGSNKEIVLNNVTGLIVDSNSSSFAQAIQYLKDTPQELTRLGSGAKEYASSTFSNEKFVDRCLEVYKLALK